MISPRHDLTKRMHGSARGRKDQCMQYSLDKSDSGSYPVSDKKSGKGEWMTDRIPDVPDAELAVLRELWDKGPESIRQLTDALYPGGSDAHYATVQKLLERLEAKGR